MTARELLNAPVWQLLDSPVIEADCIDAMRAMPDRSIDAIVTDPPYGLSREPDVAEVLTHWLAGDDYQHRGGGFMGSTWDSFVPGPAYWREALRVLKPGGHLLAFGGTRTYDLLVIAVRLAGFAIRDSIAHVRSIPTEGVIAAWHRWSEDASNAGVRFREEGDGSALGPVLLSTSLDESPAGAIIAELRSREAHLTDEASWRSALSGADEGTTASNALVSIAGISPASPAPSSTTSSTAPADVLDWLDASMAARTRAVEALRIWLGSGPSSKRAATDALCAALTDALRHITCAQSETFRSFDTTLRMVSASAMTVTTTASMAASLLAFTAATLEAEGGDAEEASTGPLLWMYGSGFP